jgi:hypothetical protein
VGRMLIGEESDVFVQFWFAVVVVGVVLSEVSPVQVLFVSPRTVCVWCGVVRVCW